MPRFIDLVSKYTITPLVRAGLKPELQKFADEQAANLKKNLPEAIAEAKAIEKLSGTPMGSAIPAAQMSGLQQLRSETKPGTGISFQLLRDFSVYHWATRACINKRQEQIHNLAWDIVSAEPDNTPDENSVADVKRFMKHIAGPNRTFRQFLDMFIDDLLTIDGASIYHVKNGLNELQYLWPIDSASIRMRLNEQGQLPPPPENAYVQYVNGKIVAEMTTDDMKYLMMNARTVTPYGLSPLESLILVVNSAIKSELSNLAILQEGNIPEGLLVSPPEWTPDQIKVFQEHWDAMLSGNFGQQRRVKVIPGGATTPYIPTKKPSDMEFEAFEKWLTIKTCAMFGVPPQSIGITQNVNRSSAQEQSTIAINEAIQPMASLIEEYFDSVIEELGYTDLHFKFLGFDARDDVKQADVNTKYIGFGAITINEARQDMGKDPIDGGDQAFVMTASGPVLLNDIINPAPVIPQPTTPPPQTEQKMASEDQPTPTEELKRWRTVALHDLKRGKGFRKFRTTILDEETVETIDAELPTCQSPEEIKNVFRKHLGADSDKIITAASALLEDLEKLMSTNGSKPTITIHQ